jgi:hypothetical protein
MMKYDYAPDLQTAVKEVSKSMPNAHAALFPSGGTAIPQVR